jgi:hypothetical protein
MLNQDKKIFLEKRKERPQTLAAALGSVLDTFGVRPSDADLAENWLTIVGEEIAKISNVIAVKITKNKKFNIVLQPVSPAFAMELSYSIDKCKDRINKYYGHDAVEKITIRK